MQEKRIEIDLGNGVMLCAEESAVYNEIYVFIEKDGCVWQDLVIAGEQYCYENHEIVRQRGEYFVKVYANEQTEDYTDEFTIKQYEEEGE